MGTIMGLGKFLVPMVPIGPRISTSSPALLLYLENILEEEG
jgi:hypothetical protein